MKRPRCWLTSMQQAFVNLRSGTPKKLAPPVPGYYENLHPHDRSILDEVLSCSAIGSPDTVRRELKAFVGSSPAPMRSSLPHDLRPCGSPAVV